MTEEEREAFAKVNGHPPVADKVVCVDFDGTIAPFGDLFGYPAPNPGAEEFMSRLREDGYRIVIFTSRMSISWHLDERPGDVFAGLHEQREYIRTYCAFYGIPFDEITGEKVPAEAYIDDKAIRFTDWDSASRQFFGEPS